MGRATTRRRAAGEVSDQLLAALSHELRTPLNGVLGMAGLLGQTRLDANQRAYVKALQESGEHLLELVNDVLDLARLEAEGFQPNPAPTDIERLLQSTAELLSPRANAKGLEIAWASDPDLPLVAADEGRLRQILFNLAGNAVKFTSEGGVLLRAVKLASPRGTVLRLSVRDSGPGVSETDRERIFQPFARGSAALAGAIESTGLGLAIVRRLADALDGRIGLDTSMGEGSDFWFEIPMVQAGPAPLDRPLKDLVVAVASPNVIVAQAAASQIEACGGRPIVFEGLAEAKAAPRGAPVLIDVTGVRRPRSLPGHPCIMLLTPDERGRIPGLRRHGFEGYLIKPLRRTSLAVRVLAVLRREEPTQASADDERAQPAAAVGARVLLAEDNPINALLARALLEREGCAVDHVCDGAQAIAAACTGAYDLVLLDLRMPDRDGVAVAAEVRAKGVRTPIAALTADAFAAQRRACLEAGMDDFLSKPLNPSALRTVLARWVGRATESPIRQTRASV
jgi:CheY-like chemotaxis protein